MDQNIIKPVSLTQPIIKKGWFSTTYDNPWNIPTNGAWKAFKSMYTEKDNSNIPKKAEELNSTLPVSCGDLSLFNPSTDSSNSNMKYMWIGHASCLVQVDGMNVLTDPIFSDRCFFSQSLGPKRYRPVPCRIKDLPQIHAVVISHNHYDHLDYSSVCELHKRFGDSLHWFVPKGLKAWMSSNVGTTNENVTELMWWETSSLMTPGGSNQNLIKFVLTPTRHWCSRKGPIDKNKVLWGSWCVIGPNNRFYFTGDTAYCPVFKEIGQEHGPFDLAAIPIGAYLPRAFMSASHIDPAEAVKLHEDIQSKRSIGIHWGTFKLSKEHYLAPREDLHKCMEESDRSKPFYTIGHGEIIQV